MSTENGTMRRARTDLWTKAEAIIAEAIWHIEGMPPSEHLTRAVALLAEAQNAVADYVDGEPEEARDA